jgi:hypothetical protein
VIHALLYSSFLLLSKKQVKDLAKGIHSFYIIQVQNCLDHGNLHCAIMVYNFINIHSEATKLIIVKYFKKHKRFHTVNKYYLKITYYENCLLGCDVTHMHTDISEESAASDIRVP